jgi:hypothetical protein
MTYLLAIFCLALIFGARMSVGAMVCDKRRLLMNATTVGDGALGPFPADFGSGARRVHAGDMQGCFIGRIEVVVGTFSGTSITATFETSHDGITWTPWFSTAALTAAGTTVKLAEDDFESPARFVRVSWANAGSGTAPVTVRLFYAQVGPRGSYAPPGMTDRY